MKQLSQIQKKYTEDSKSLQIQVQEYKPQQLATSKPNRRIFQSQNAVFLDEKSKSMFRRGDKQIPIKFYLKREQQNTYSAILPTCFTNQNLTLSKASSSSSIYQYNSFMSHSYLGRQKLKSHHPLTNQFMLRTSLIHRMQTHNLEQFSQNETRVSFFNHLECESPQNSDSSTWRVGKTSLFTILFIIVFVGITTILSKWVGL